MPNNYMAFADGLIIACCLGISVLALNKSRVSEAGNRVVAVAMAGVIIGVINLGLDAHWVVPQVRNVMTLLAIIYIAGASKGILLGLFLSLFLFKQLRPINRIECAEPDVR